MVQKHVVPWCILDVFKKDHGSQKHVLYIVSWLIRSML